MKSVKSIQKFPHIIGSYVYAMNKFLIIFRLPMSFSSYVGKLPLSQKATQSVPILAYSSGCITCVISFTKFGKLFVE